MACSQCNNAVACIVCEDLTETFHLQSYSAILLHNKRLSLYDIDYLKIESVGVGCLVLRADCDKGRIDHVVCDGDKVELEARFLSKSRLDCRPSNLVDKLAVDYKCIASDDCVSRW